ncbi:MAG: GT4 family glycosyltransferase PelF [Acidobacteria bacterium]|nr:GT4 family glycosyltransferase PelF [Acidobacteriota bacterium]
MTRSVLLTTDGTYPHYSGGVSTWCDQLVRHLANVDFHLLSIVHSPYQPQVYKLPQNVRSLEAISLWGNEDPGFPSGSFADSYERKLRTTKEKIAEGFVPSFAVVVQSVFAGSAADAMAFGQALARLQRYFESYDYAETMTSSLAWACFKKCSAQPAALSMEDATTCMRWLVRYLTITARPNIVTDVVHASMAGLAAVPGVLSKIQYGTYFLITEHGIHLRELYMSLSRMNGSEPCRRFLLGWNQAIVGMNYYYADHVTCLGEFNQKWQVAFGVDPAKVEFVPNGVDPLRFFPEPRAPSARPTVLTLARIFPLKGIDTLLRAAAIVRDQVPLVKFRILGDVADPAYFAECQRIIAENQLEMAVEFGVTKEAGLELRRADVFCLPSVSEGLPYTILEAMFSGCPVVATDVGNVSDALSGTGLLVRPNNPPELARALLTVLDGPGASGLRDKLSAAALERARQHYTLEKAIRPFQFQYEGRQHCHQTLQSA